MTCRGPRASLPADAPGEGPPCHSQRPGAPGVPGLVATSLPSLPPCTHGFSCDSDNDGCAEGHLLPDSVPSEPSLSHVHADAVPTHIVTLQEQGEHRSLEGHGARPASGTFRGPEPWTRRTLRVGGSGRLSRASSVAARAQGSRGPCARRSRLRGPRAPPAASARMTIAAREPIMASVATTSCDGAARPAAGWTHRATRSSASPCGTAQPPCSTTACGSANSVSARPPPRLQRGGPIVPQPGRASLPETLVPAQGGSRRPPERCALT